MRILVGDIINTSLWPQSQVNQIISKNINDKYPTKSVPTTPYSDSYEDVEISDEAMQLYKKDLQSSQA